MSLCWSTCPPLCPAEEVSEREAWWAPGVQAGLTHHRWEKVRGKSMSVTTPVQAKWQQQLCILLYPDLLRDWRGRTPNKECSSHWLSFTHNQCQTLIAQVLKNLLTHKVPIFHSWVLLVVDKQTTTISKLNVRHFQLLNQQLYEENWSVILRTINHMKEQKVLAHRENPRQHLIN